jgi:chitodextrinase
MSAVMYLPDKIMKAGSWADPDFNDSMAPGYTASGQTAVLDMTQASPAWKSTAPMNYGRAYENLTLLPDGTVLASGGESYSDGINLSKGVLPAEIWNPTTQAWTTVASLSTPREYHSTAVLLPDGRVLMAGGGALEGFSGVTNEDSAEIYSPPYLFKGTRPTITSVPSTVNYGQAFQVSTPDAASITKVALVGVPSVTHDDNPTARYIPLTFTAGSGSLTVTPPSNRNVAPPGYYYLFILNGNGVPSVASFVRFPAPWEDTQPPTAPGNLAATVSQSSVSLSWTASTDNVGVTVYDVFRSTTSGFTPSIANRIAQTSNLSYTDANRPAGTYYYVVEAEDAAGNASPPSNQATAVVAGDTTPPSAPTNLTGTGGIGTASLSWTASTDNVGVTGYEIWRGTASGAETKVGTSTSTSYTDTVAAGTYFYVVKADDAAGNVSAASNEVSVTVTSDTSPPSVSITAPAAGATVSATVCVTASASDNVGVAGVQFKLDGANLGAEDTSSPYSVSWDTTTASNGTHTLTAVARDAAGNTTTSAAVTVTVSNTAPTGLVAAYNFNAGSGTTLADRSGTGNNGTIANGTWSTSGHTGGALSFNGTSTLVTIPDSASLDLTNSLTLEAWVNPSALGTAWRCVLFKEQPNDMIYSLYANQNTTRPIGQVFTGGIEQNSTGSAALTLNAWAHLAVTYDGTALKLYVNGTLVHTTLVTGALPTSTGPLHMGGDSVWGEWFKGLIDDVRVYNVALTQAQIQTDMNTPVP